MSHKCVISQFPDAELVILNSKTFLLRKCFDALKTRLKMSEIAPFQNNRRHYQCLQVNRREQALNKSKQKERD